MRSAGHDRAPLSLFDSSAAARQFAFKIDSQCVDCPRQIGFGWQAADKLVVRCVEGRRESIARHIQPGGAIECVKSLLPRDTVSVERAAEIEQQRFDRLVHCMARTLSRLTTPEIAARTMSRLHLL